MICPTCHQLVRGRTKHLLDDADVSALLKMWHYIIEQKENKIDVRQAQLSYTERSRVTQLRFHALIAKYRINGRQKQATWLLTKRGAQFLKGKINVPKYVYTQNNEVVDHSIETVNRRDYRVLDDFTGHFEYEIVDGDLLRLVTRQGILI